MRYVTGIISGVLVAVVVYLVAWFFARNMVDGRGTPAEVGAHVVVVLVALAVGASSFRASVRRK